MDFGNVDGIFGSVSEMDLSKSRDGDEFSSTDVPVLLTSVGDNVFNATHLLGDVVGCDGTHLFLPHLHLFLRRLCVFSYDFH